MKKTLLCAGIIGLSIAATGCGARDHNANYITRAARTNHMTGNYHHTRGENYIPGEEYIIGNQTRGLNNRHNNRLANNVSGVANQVTQGTNRHQQATRHHETNRQHQTNRHHNTHMADPMVTREARNTDYHQGIGHHYGMTDNGMNDMNHDVAYRGVHR